MRIMAIDYGDAHTGVALSDPTGLLTGTALVIDSRKADTVLAELARLARENGVTEVVMGFPRNMDGTEGPRAEKCRRVAALLQTVCGVPVCLWDERRTTVTAAGILADNNVYGDKRRRQLDAVAAQVILEGFLAWRRNHPGELPQA